MKINGRTLTPHAICIIIIVVNKFSVFCSLQCIKCSKNAVLQQKLEKEKLMAKKYIKRENLDFAAKFLKTDLIKIITGPRRVGKSVFALLLLKDVDFAYINFDDESFLKIKNNDEILKALFEVYPNAKIIFFDEIQNLNNWELFVNKLQRRGYNIILTGSNAKLLSRELAINLTGRHINIEVFPFSFAEFLTAKNYDTEKEFMNVPENKGQVLNYLDEYMKNGGYPEVVVKNLDPREYLETLFDAVLFKDIVKRYKIRFAQKLYDLAVYLASNFSGEFSFTKLKNILEFNSTKTLQDYFGYLQETYLFFSLNRFSFKLKEQFKAPKKIYLMDNGFIQAKAFQHSQNTGKLMENLIFIEMLRRGYHQNRDIFLYKTKNNKEIDFVVKQEANVKKLIQACFGLEAAETQRREIKALLEASAELKCNDLEVITWDKDAIEKIKDKEVKYVPLWNWLLKKK